LAITTTYSGSIGVRPAVNRARRVGRATKPAGLLDALRSPEDARCVKRATVFVLVAFAAAASVAAAGIRPTDQRLAERLTLRLADFDSRWTTDSPPSTRLDRVPCATAPKIEGAITGYSKSAGFLPRDHADKRYATDTTRVFLSLATARAWYAWAGAGESACLLKRAVASWKRYGHGFKVSRLRHARNSLTLHCSSCPAHQLSAWRYGFTLAKQGQNDTTFVIDWVVVRKERAVIALYFESVDFPFGPDGGRLVSKLLERR